MCLLRNVSNDLMVAPLGQTELGGRNCEGFSPDPYSSSVLVSDTVEGA